GEFVINKAAVQRLGTGFFDAINQMKAPAQALAQHALGFAEGGGVNIERNLLARINIGGEVLGKDTVGEVSAEKNRQDDAMRQAIMEQSRRSGDLASTVRGLTQRPLSVQVAGRDMVRATQPDVDRIAARRL
ncbi:MAG: hypothetical protein WCP34_11800, partial [Pseudomonadota bacterium]